MWPGPFAYPFNRGWRPALGRSAERAADVPVPQRQTFYDIAFSVCCEVISNILNTVVTLVNVDAVSSGDYIMLRCS